MAVPLKLADAKIMFDVDHSHTIPLSPALILRCGLYLAEQEGAYPKTTTISRYAGKPTSNVTRSEDRLWAEHYLLGERNPRNVTAVDTVVLIDGADALVATGFALKKRGRVFVDEAMQPIESDNILQDLPAASALKLGDVDIDTSVNRLRELHILQDTDAGLSLNRPVWRRNKFIYYELAQDPTRTLNDVRTLFGKTDVFLGESGAELKDLLKSMSHTTSYETLERSVHLLLCLAFPDQKLQDLVEPLRRLDVPLAPLLARMKQISPLSPAQLTRLEKWLYMARFSVLKSAGVNGIRRKALDEQRDEENS